MAAPPRVAVVARAVWPLHGHGGLERSVYDLVRHLARRGAPVTLIAPPARAGQQGAVSQAFDPAHVTILPVPYVTFPGANRAGTTILDRSTSYLLFAERAGRAALALARESQIDIVHAFGASALGYARARHRPVPFVLNPQGLEEFGATGVQPRLKALAYAPLRRAVRACARAADVVIATDTALEQTVQRHLSPRPDQLRTIPNGIDLEEIDGLAGPADGRRVRQASSVPPSSLVLLSVGRLERNKGFDALAAALARLASTNGPLAHRDWTWVLAGDGPFRLAIERAIAAAGIGSHVRLVGRVNDADLHAWYEAATLFVHPSRFEGSSLVTLEAMAHRRPIVATRAGGLPDKVRPGVNGWLAEPDDPASLAHAIAEAIGAPQLEAMGAAGRALVAREFAWSVLADRWLSLYRDLRSASVSSPRTLR